MKLDDHYTPAELAKLAVSLAGLRKPHIVADLSAGEGSLLVQAAQRWPSARIVATDISRHTVAELARRRRQKWEVGRCDFLAPRSRNACQVLRAVNGKVSLLLLNPPFSCRGGSYRIVATPEGPIRTSIAMAFLLLGLGYLSARGQVVAILPAGSLFNQKDRAAWNYVKQRFAVRKLARLKNNSFPKCAASSVLVMLTPTNRSPQRSSGHRRAHPTPPRIRAQARTEIVRGTCPVHLIPDNASGPTLVHYTDLQKASVVLNGHRGFGLHRCVRGPAVLIPRVGQITREKVSILVSARSVMISDCVIALKTQSLRSARRIRRLLIENFQVLVHGYVGTGAPHITLDRLRAVLNRLGVVESVS
jgi:hypothetical protein